jgi:hypothetical protein
MTPKVKKDITNRIAKIESGRFGDDDIRLLYLDIRDCSQLERVSGDVVDVLYDIFHFCAHPNARDRGLVFERTKKKVKATVQTLLKNPDINLQAEPIKVDIVSSLNNVLTKLTIVHNSKNLQRQKEKILTSTYSLLKDVKMVIEDDDIEGVLIHYDTEIKCPMISFKMKPFVARHELTDDEGRSYTVKVNGEPTIRFRLM